MTPLYQIIYMERPPIHGAFAICEKFPKNCLLGSALLILPFPSKCPMINIMIFHQVFLILAAILPIMLYTAFIILVLYNYLKEAYIDVSFMIIRKYQFLQLRFLISLFVFESTIFNILDKDKVRLVKCVP